VQRGESQAALIPAFSRGEKEKSLTAGFRGMGRGFAGTDGDGSHEWDSGTSPAGVRDSLSLRERAGVREARFNPRDRFM